MRSSVRFSFLALLVGVIVAVAAPAAANAAFGVGKFFAANCKTAACEPGDVTAEAFTQAGGHPPAGITDFTVNTEPGGEIPSGIATEGPVTKIRTDVAPGVSTNPEAVPQCTEAEFNGVEVAEGLFTPPAAGCAAAVIGENKVKIFPGATPDVELTGTVYNLTPTKGLSSLFAVALDAAPLGAPAGVVAHTFIKGHVEWASDYHDYFEIEVSPKLPLVSSRLVFKGNIGEGEAPIGSGGFLTNPTSCTGIGPQTTSKITLESASKTTGTATYEGPVGSENCGAVPFGFGVGPNLGLTPETTQSDAPDGITTSVSEAHDLTATGIDTSQVKSAKITLPEGMTLNPSAAREVTKRARRRRARSARATSQLPGRLENRHGDSQRARAAGWIADRQGLPRWSKKAVRSRARRTRSTSTPSPNSMASRCASKAKRTERNDRAVTATFGSAPGQPRNSRSRPHTALQGRRAGADREPAGVRHGREPSELRAGMRTGSSSSPSMTPFIVDNDGKAAHAPVAAVLAQAGDVEPDVDCRREHELHVQTETSGRQPVLSQIKTTLPAGLVGADPEGDAVHRSAGIEQHLPGYEPDRDGRGGIRLRSDAVHVQQRRGLPDGPVQGSSVRAVDRRASRRRPVQPRPGDDARDDQHRPIHGARDDDGDAADDRQGDSDPPAWRDRLDQQAGLPAEPDELRGDGDRNDRHLDARRDAGVAERPFQLGNCSALKFKPTFKAKTSARTSKANGASLETTINEVPGQSNIKSVKVQLPKQLPSRLTTLQKACPAATFESEPVPLPVRLVRRRRARQHADAARQTQGPAILVSHANAAFPDLDLVMEANGVRTILVGNTEIKKGITTTTFASTPDVPVSSITVNLPLGAHSALAANGNLCANSLVMPTTITGQNGTVVKQNTKIAVANCGVRIVGHKVVGNTAYITVQTFAAGRDQRQRRQPGGERSASSARRRKR